MSTSSPSLRFRFRPSPRAGPGACPGKGKVKGKEVVLTRRRVGGYKEGAPHNFHQFWGVQNHVVLYTSNIGFS